MPTLSAPTLLQAWEEALDLPMPRRAVTLLAAGHPASHDEIAAWSLARRDGALFDLRIQLFGGHADALADCPRCAERLEMQVDLRAMRPARRGREAKNGLKSAQLDGYRVSYRAPDSTDLLAIALSDGFQGDRRNPGDHDGHDIGVAENARAALIDRCVQSVTRAGAPLAHSALPDAVVELVAQRIAADQAAADVLLQLSCASCGHTWQAPFDIASFLWHEVDAWARRLLREVHALARAYGWSERDILALSPRRRRIYLDLIGA